MTIKFWEKHVHVWIETGRAKIPGVRWDVEHVQGMGMIERLADAAMDRTGVHLRCTTCGDVASRILEGWVA